MHIRNIDGCKAKMSMYVPYLRLVLLICADNHLEIIRHEWDYGIIYSNDIGIEIFQIVFISDTLYILFTLFVFR